MMGPNRAGLEHGQPSQPVLSQKVKSYTRDCESRALTRANQFFKWNLLNDLGLAKDQMTPSTSQGEPIFQKQFSN